jgi:hypothetical protein
LALSPSFQLGLSPMALTPEVTHAGSYSPFF